MTCPLITPEQREQLQTEWTQRQQALESQLAEQLAGQTRTEFARDLLEQDGDDAPQRDADREVALARADHEVDELGQVSRALRRLQDADFGRCGDCGGAIPFERLRLEPGTERCVACASAHEQRPPGASI
jgi:DnaK suppressor protein